MFFKYWYLQMKNNGINVLTVQNYTLSLYVPQPHCIIHQWRQYEDILHCFSTTVTVILKWHASIWPYCINNVKYSLLIFVNRSNQLHDIYQSVYQFLKNTFIFKRKCERKLLKIFNFLQLLSIFIRKYDARHCIFSYFDINWPNLGIKYSYEIIYNKFI